MEALIVPIIRHRDHRVRLKNLDNIVRSLTGSSDKLNNMDKSQEVPFALQRNRVEIDDSYDDSSFDKTPKRDTKPSLDNKNLENISDDKDEDKCDDVSSTSSDGNSSENDSGESVLSDGTLPEGWARFTTDDGNNYTYYFNEYTNESSWEKPTKPGYVITLYCDLYVPIIEVFSFISIYAVTNTVKIVTTRIMSR